MGWAFYRCNIASLCILLLVVLPHSFLRKRLLQDMLVEADVLMTRYRTWPKASSSSTLSDPVPAMQVCRMKNEGVVTKVTK